MLELSLSILPESAEDGGDELLEFSEESSSEVAPTRFSDDAVSPMGKAKCIAPRAAIRLHSRTKQSSGFVDHIFLIEFMLNSLSCSATFARYAMFWKTYDQHWRQILKFLPTSTHGTCDECAEFKDLFRSTPATWSSLWNPR